MQRLVGGHEEVLGGGGRTTVVCKGKGRGGGEGVGGGGGRLRLTDPRVATAGGWSYCTPLRLAERQGVSA